MEVLNFINSHENWEELLINKPYNLKISHNGDYVMLSYNMLLSDMSLAICKECRGLIIRKENERWIAVCIPFFKFFNAQERYADTSLMDWSTTKVLQKVDGSLCKFYYDRGQWHVSSNGTIDARTNKIGDFSFYSLVEMAIGDLNNLFSVLDPDYTYMFELTTPYNKIVVQYEGSHLWYLGRRNNHTLQEDNVAPNFDSLLYPKLYDYRDIEACYKAAEGMDLTEEGFVCVDMAYHRIKIKGAAYLEAHRLRGNGPLTLRRLCEMWQNNTLDDFIAICPEYKSFIDDFTEAIGELVLELYAAYAETIEINNRAELAHELFELDFSPVARAYVFSLRDKHCIDSIDYLKKMRPRALSEILQQYMRSSEIQTVEEDV